MAAVLGSGFKCGPHKPYSSLQSTASTSSSSSLQYIYCIYYMYIVYIQFRFEQHVELSFNLTFVGFNLSMLLSTEALCKIWLGLRIIEFSRYAKHLWIALLATHLRFVTPIRQRRGCLRKIQIESQSPFVAPGMSSGNRGIIKDSPRMYPTIGGAWAKATHATKVKGATGGPAWAATLPSPCS